MDQLQNAHLVQGHLELSQSEPHVMPQSKAHQALNDWCCIESSLTAMK